MVVVHVWWIVASSYLWVDGWIVVSSGWLDKMAVVDG